MRIARTLLTLAALAAGTLAQAAGSVQVSFDKPDEFVDIGHNRWDQERALDQLREVFKGWGARLPDGQTLKVEVLDVDLAGRLQPRRGDEIRVLNGRADWPRIKLRWTLSAGDRTLVGVIVEVKLPLVLIQYDELYRKLGNRPQTEWVNVDTISAPVD